LVTIVSKGIDPFLQALISYAGDRVTVEPVGAIPSIGLAQRVDLGTLVFGENSTSPEIIDGFAGLEVFDVVPDLGLSSAILTP
jgi:hypothetical protein